MNVVALKPHDQAADLPMPTQPAGHQPLKLTGFAEKIANAVDARELVIAMQAADAWAQNVARDNELPRDRADELAKKVQQVVLQTYKADHSPFSVAALVESCLNETVRPPIAN